MQPASLTTCFLPAERAEKSELYRLREIVELAPLLKPILNGMPEGVLILNRDRQIISANKAFIEALDLKDEETLIGLRPGEAFNCVNAKEHGNCGTSMLCRKCGAAQVLYTCGMKKKCTGECHIIIEVGRKTEVLDLVTWGTPFSIGANDFTLFAMADISHERRRRLLERVFFHDVLNTAGGIRSVSEILQGTISNEHKDLVNIMYTGSDRLIHDIMSQKLLLEAENRELALKIEKINVRALLEDMVRFFETAGYGTRSFTIDAGEGLPPDAVLSTDRSLLERCLENLIKNAAEASPPKGLITIGAREADGRITFRVHNEGCMPDDVQTRLFRSSFSTKGHQRGLGLYSVRLFAEHYLGGKVRFTSSEEQGTSFYIELDCPGN